MRKILSAVFAATVAAALLPAPARTDGCYMPTDAEWRRQRERSLILEPNQKALVYFDRGSEQLIISPNYAGQMSDFAWVVPTPARPSVEILKGAPFHELARLIEPAPPRMAKGMAGRSSFPAPAGVTVLERKTVGDYDVSVLSATDSGSLVRWLKENKYHLPPRAEAPMKQYIAERWTFVASKIRLNDTARGLKTGTLSPLKLTFRSARPVYPMRLSGANAQPFSLLLYVAEPARGNSSLVPVTEPGLPSRSGSKVLLASMRPSFPTLAQFSPGPLEVMWIDERLRPDQCVRDFVWDHKGRPIIRARGLR